MTMTTMIVAAIIGGIAGAIAGLFGDGFASGLVPGVIAGGITGLLASFVPRTEMGPRMAVEFFPIAGIVGAVAGAAVTDAGWAGAFIGCGVGGTLGLLYPVMVMAILKIK